MSSRFKGSTVRILASGLVGLALVAGVATGIFAQHSNSASASKRGQGAVHGSAAHGATASGVVNLATLPAASAAQIKAAAAQAAKAAKMTNRPLKTAAQLAASQQWMKTHASALPKTTSAPRAPQGTNTYGNGAIAPVTSSHDGLNSNDGGGWYPPDQALSAAPGYIIEGVNNVMVVYNTSYGVKYGPWTPDQVFASVKTSGDFFSDPQITFDAERAVYVIAWLEINPSTGADYIDIAISKTSTPSPLSNFNVYKTDPRVASSDYFCDYPTLGYDYWGMYVTCATFSISNGSFLGNDTYAYSLNNMLSGTLGTWDYWYSVVTDLSDGAGGYLPIYRLSPTIEDGVPQAEWVTGTDAGWLGTSASANQTVCSITNTHAIGTATLPTYWCNWTSLPLAYDDPSGAAEAGTTATVYPGYGYKQVAYRNGQLYFALPMTINCANAVVDDGILWAVVDPQLGTIASHNPQLGNGVYGAYSQAGYWCYTGGDSYLPTLMAGTEGDMVLVFNFSSSSVAPSIAYTSRTAADAPGTMDQGGTGLYVIQGTNSNDSGRFGDYSACALTTNLVTRGIMYCAGEYGGSHTALGGTGWDTRIYSIRME